MVRLKGGVSAKVPTKLTVFQFQYGAIKSVGVCRSFREVVLFQFQYGAIKS